MTGLSSRLESLATGSLDALERSAFDYFVRYTNPRNGLIADRSDRASPASIAAVGFGLVAHAIGAERGYVTRPEAARRVLATLRSFRAGVQGEDPDSMGNKGFYYHFLDTDTARRSGRSELSLIDTGFLLAGALVAARYFSSSTEEEREIREVAQGLYLRADWKWALGSGTTLSHGWKPECGFLRYGWEGYSEGLLLYLFALGSPSNPLDEASYQAWTNTYQWESLYGRDFLYAGPLFIHQFSHLFVDFRGIQDRFMREKGIDYFENSRRATQVQREYAMRNPAGFLGYGENCFGITASHGPGFVERRLNDAKRHFFEYSARGVPYGPDDGTLAPWSVAASLPFAPEIVLPCIGHVLEAYPEVLDEGGRLRSFNPTFKDGEGGAGFWISPASFGIEQGALLLMLENERSGFVWRLLRECEPLVTGLRRAGFQGGWM